MGCLCEVNSRTTTPGRFITLEGGEGAGKTTQISRLKDWLEDKAIPVMTTREPGGSDGAEQIRDLLVNGEVSRWDPMTEALLHFAARKDHVEKVVKPALAAGYWVISDRFADSTMAYQGYGHDLGVEVISDLYKLVLPDFSTDLTIILDLSVEEGLGRANARSGGEDRYERMETGFHQRLRDGFREIAEQSPDRCALVDASADADNVFSALVEVVETRLFQDQD
jgi:dTMP kinase